MAKLKSENVLNDLEKALLAFKKKHFILHLYIAGASKRSFRAVTNIRDFCEKHLKGHYKLEVIDIYQQPECTKDDQVIVAPTLVKKLPPPLKRFIGDMANIDQFFIGFTTKLLQGKSAKRKVRKRKK